MGDFDFVRASWPDIHEDAARAESYLTSDPRAACVYARRTVELLVAHLYDLIPLAAPYADDLAARINDASFRNVAGVGIVTKLNLIRKVGNTAVHRAQPVPPDAALQALRELFHVLVWAAFRYSTAPDAVPTGAQFDPAVAKRAAPLTRQEVQRLAERFQAQDAAHRRELEARDELLEAQNAELAELRAQVAAAQAAKTHTVDTHDYDEKATRTLLIDQYLREAGWVLDEKRDREYPVTGMPNESGTGYVDYVLWGADGLPLAVVEAKRTEKSAQIGQQQASLYADALEREFGRRPVVFYTNGLEHFLWDDAAGYPPREISGFFTRDELELLIQRRITRLPLASAPISNAIVERPYQHRAIKATGDAFDAKQRQALLVMATGSGKTRTVIALIEQLMKQGWVKRALFLADRRALVTQAVNAFKEHLPKASPVNLLTDPGAEGRVYVSTYPTMMGLIEDAATSRFGAGHFDLIVIDEAHRSVYAKYGAIFRHFDALLVGLTATPKDEVDHNTYRLFHLEDGVPTDAYSLEEAVVDGYLAPPRAVSVGTTFLRQGIVYADLTEDEKDQWDALDWGEDGPPDGVGAEELNRFLFNEDTVDKVLETLMTRGYTVAGGDRLGKTIIFAKNQEHALFIQKRFDLRWPEHGGGFAQVITYAMPYAQNLIDDFSQTDKAPHIAISVDMLDTGIDVPDVVNLVFFKMVRSTSKFWQMIGRGTRLRPDLYGPGDDKRDFLVFDFCGNLEYFSQDLPGSEGTIRKPLSHRLFEQRVRLVTALDQAGVYTPVRDAAASVLRAVVAGMNLDNILVRRHRASVARFTRPEAWARVTPEDAEQLLQLAGLPTASVDADEQAKRFDLLILRAQLASIEGDVGALDAVRRSVQQLADSLLTKTSIPAVAAEAVLLEAVASDEWWVDVTLPMLESARIRLRGLVRLADRASRARVYTDFEDTLAEAVEIDLPGIAPGTDFERFRKKASVYLRAHEDDLALQRLRRNRQLTGQDLEELERMLHEAGGADPDIVRAREASGGLGVFIRTLVGLDRSAAEEAFAGFLKDRPFTVNQVRFVDLIIGELTITGVMEPARLFESPYTDSAPTGPEDLFPEADVARIVGVLRDVSARAVPA